MSHHSMQKRFPIYVISISSSSITTNYTSICINILDKIYIGSTGTLFKKRFYNHRQSFINVNNRNATELSKYMWSCLDRFNQQPELQWSILHRTNAPTSARKICHLCNLERWEIALADDRRNLLNKRSEVSGGCPHHRSLFFPRLKPKS